MSAMLDVARADTRHRGHSVRLTLLAMALLITLPVLWFVRLAQEQTPLVCQTSSQNVVNVIDSIMRDPRTHVEGVQGVAVPHGDTGASFDSGRVYVDDVYVGVGTWWANFGDGFSSRGLQDRYTAVQPVNDLANAVSVNEFPDIPVPNESGKAARFSLHCVTVP